MGKILTGIIIGVFLASVIWVLVPFFVNKTAPTIGRFRPSATPTNAAGIATNVSNRLPASQRLPITLALTDSGAGDTTASGNTDLTSLEITISKVEAQIAPDSPLFGRGTDPNSWETLNLTQPSVELFSLRGSGAVAELGTTELGATSYQAIRLTLDSLKGRRSSGQVVDVALAGQNHTIEIRRAFAWNNPGQPIQLVLDLDGLQGLSQDGTQYTFAPTIRRLIQNDEELK